MKRKEMKELQLKCLNKYFKINDNNAEVLLVFDTFSELVDNNVGDDSVEMLNSTIFDKIENALKILPQKYTISLKIQIKDYGEYEREEANRIIRENINLKIMSLINVNSRKKRWSLALFIGGLLLLLGSFFLNRFTSIVVLNEIINIAGTLLIWESLTQYFLERFNNGFYIYQYINKIKNIDFV